MSDDEILLRINKVWENCVEPRDLPETKTLASKKCHIPKYITTIHNRSLNRRPFSRY